VGQNGLLSCWFWFSVDWHCVKGYSSCFQLGSNWFPSIPDGTAVNLLLFPTGFCLILDWENSLPSLSLWISFSWFWNCGKGFPRCFHSGTNWCLMIPDGSTTNSPQFPSRFPMNLRCVNELLSYWFWFSVDGSCRRRYFSCSQSGSNWFPTIPVGTATNPPLFPARFLLVLHWWRTDSQAFEFHSQHPEAVEGGISCVFIQV